MLKDVLDEKQSGVANPEPGLSHLNLDFLCVDQYDIFTRLHVDLAQQQSSIGLDLDYYILLIYLIRSLLARNCCI